MIIIEYIIDSFDSCLNEFSRVCSLTSVLKLDSVDRGLWYEYISKMTYRMGFYNIVFMIIT